MTSQKILLLIKSFLVPLIVLLGVLLYIVLSFLHLSFLALLVVLATIALGSFGLLKETFEDIRANQFALDYIAILAIIVALVTKEYLVGSIIALMLSTGRTLEAYGASQAKKSLSLLANRIPHEILVEQQDKTTKKTSLQQIQVGTIIIVRKGEVIPLDGKLLSSEALVDESSLTGEPYTIEKVTGDVIRSGTVNMGDAIRIQVTREEKDSTYKKIISMVEKASKEKAPMVRLADRYSVVFTIITFVIAGFAFFYNPSLNSILAVLVVATPCPLILATPIALLGGVNAAAKKRIIVKKLASLEALSRTNTIVFDKTGTITLGKPEVTNFQLIHKAAKKEKPDEKKLLGIAEAIERNSLHPLAKAIVAYAKNHNAPLLHAESVKETIGKGISAIINKKPYTLSKLPTQTADMAIALFEDKTMIGIFTFEDKIKEESKSIIAALTQLGMSLSIFTGDKKESAQRITKQLAIDVEIQADLKPEDKQRGVRILQQQGKTIAMVGDGINDAPALALADVGMVFSNEEQTAASEAADIVFLGGNFSLVMEALLGAKKTIEIAKQSIFWGIGLSITAMIFASFGLIPPIIGAFLQEGIDVAVILNALRASRG